MVKIGSLLHELYPYMHPSQNLKKKPKHTKNPLCLTSLCLKQALFSPQCFVSIQM